MLVDYQVMTIDLEHPGYSVDAVLGCHKDHTPKVQVKLSGGRLLPVLYTLPDTQLQHELHRLLFVVMLLTTITVTI